FMIVITAVVTSSFLFFYSSATPRDLHSFPTRRSSDLIGWAGTSQNHVDHLLARASRRRSYTLQAVQLSNEEVAKFYSGFANEIIWPLFHDMPSRCNFDPDYWETYQRVNQKFAAAAARTARQDDFVWVHDYHLMLT